MTGLVVGFLALAVFTMWLGFEFWALRQEVQEFQNATIQGFEVVNDSLDKIEEVTEELTYLSDSKYSGSIQ